MRPVRRQRLAALLFILGGASATLALVLFALGENANLFYDPAKVAGGAAPAGVTIRAGGMVVEGSVRHDDTGLGVSFTLSDLRGHAFDVAYTGVLPGMFREGQGILVTGRIGENGVFAADEVLAKHDENYLPPELESMAGAGGADDAQPLPQLASRIPRQDR